jgi:hypothetical protein
MISHIGNDRNIKKLLRGQLVCQIAFFFFNESKCKPQAQAQALHFK